MKECGIFRGGGSKHTLTPPKYFQGSGPPTRPPGFCSDAVTQLDFTPQKLLPN